MNTYMQTSKQPPPHYLIYYGQWENAINR